jgi:uncharacterized membrane protein YfhO
LDDDEVPVRKVNLAYQGVEVPAGKHRIRIRYRNPVVIVGLSVSLMMFLVLGYTATRRGRTPNHAI